MPPRANRAKRKEQISFQLVTDENGETILRPLTFPKNVKNKKDLEKLLPQDFPMDIVEDDGCINSAYKQQTNFSREGGDDGLSAEDRRLLEKFKNMSLGELGFDDNGDLLDGKTDEDFDPTMFDNLDDDDAEVIDLSQDPEFSLSQSKASKMNDLLLTEKNRQTGNYDDLSSVYAYDYNKHFRPITGLGTFLTPNDGVITLDPSQMEPIIPAIPENDTDYIQDLATDENVKRRHETIQAQVKATVVSAASGLTLPVFESNAKYNVLTEDFLTPFETGETEGYEEIEDNIFELLLQSSDDEGDGMSRKELLASLEDGSLFSQQQDHDYAEMGIVKKRGAQVGAWSDEEEEEENDQDFGYGTDDDFGYDDDDRAYNYDGYDDNNDEPLEEVTLMLDEQDLDDTIGQMYFAAIKDKQKKAQQDKQLISESKQNDDIEDIDPVSKDADTLRLLHLLNVYEDSEEDDFDDVDTMGGAKLAKYHKKLESLRHANSDEDGYDDEDGYYDDEDEDYYDAENDDGPMFTVNKQGLDLTDGEVRKAIHEFVHGKAQRIKQTAQPDTIPDEIVQVTKRMIAEQYAAPQPSMKQVGKEIDRFFAKKKKDVSDIRTIKTTMSTVSNIPTTIKELRVKTVAVSKTNQKEILKNSIKSQHGRESIFNKKASEINTIKLSSETAIPLGVMAKHRSDREAKRKEQQQIKNNDQIQEFADMTAKNTQMNAGNSKRSTIPLNITNDHVHDRCCDHNHNDEHEFVSAAAGAKKRSVMISDEVETSTISEETTARPSTGAENAPKRKLLFSLPTEGIATTVNFGFVKHHEVVDSDDENDKQKKHVDKYAHKKDKADLDEDAGLYSQLDLSKYGDDEDEDEDDELDQDALYIRGMARKRGETAEERKARKVAVKAERQARRLEKSETKEMFKQAGKRQKHLEMVNKFYNTPHKKIL